MGRASKYKKLDNADTVTIDKHDDGFKKIRNVFGTKNTKAHNNVVDVNGRCDVVASDFYVSQLRNFLAKNSNASFDCHKHQHQTNLTNSSEPKNQQDFKRKCKRAVYNFMKGLLDERKFKKINKFNQEEPIYFECDASYTKNINKTEVKPKKSSKQNKQQNKNDNKFNGMQNISIRVERPTTATAPDHHQESPSKRPPHLFSKASTTCENTNIQNIASRSASSEEDNSPTELNNCRRLIDKPPLVKRLAMGLLRTSEESRPLVLNTPSPTSGSMHTISDGYVNEGICDPDKIISSKFGDSCRKSLTSVLDKSYRDPCEFDLKKHFLRETSSANSSPKMFAFSTKEKRIRGLSILEQAELKDAPWFQAGLPREISLEVLSRKSPGAFLVRQSSTKPGCFALSLRVPPPAPKVAHYLILRTSQGYKIKGFTKEFSSLRALITHHSVMPELLPVPLSLPRPQNVVPERRHLDDFDTYGSLTDFRKMMSDLNV
ncbi:uncharacterized protein LOC116338542 isoform X2 [Contarinia nasturtii]|uniref:uncharacterized protein LOC116338542 isoform X2 n=1 Tax=Contarinia nasturtii TaxID=265458 RepID=UPI0012D3B003|nr:uncharacterized protein LOC116338542 isoform X2 [Contarinia nasturtii]